MTTFIEVGTIDQIGAQAATVVAIPHSKVALFNVQGCIFAMDDACVRCGASLSQGERSGRRVRCPGCGWQYDVVTGRINDIEALCTTVYEVNVEASKVMLEVPVAVTPP
ncbi:MAG TPA: Rieske 2Fe-2S domain-containing protein [Casimicrobiaceae bacterium]|nr:Rieske 2Fe-2S domain-containing protein [Casimicrobiaceae bacterium]